MIDNIQCEDNKLLKYKITQIDKKLDLVLEQFDLVLKSNARLRKDLPDIIAETIHHGKVK